MKTVTLISDTRDSLIDMMHNDSDPGQWIVQRWKKVFWFKTRVSSDWFTDEQQALTFANKLKQEHSVKLQFS